MPRWLLIIALLPLFLSGQRLPAQELTPEMVRRSIDMGVEYLKKEQHPRNGDWTEYTFHSGGVTALCTLALINSGVKKNDPAVQKALVSLRDIGLPRGSTYATSMQTMAFAAADPERDRLLIERNARYLEAIQIRDGPGKGGWGYADGSVTADNSNSQFALLALYEAERSGVKVNDQTWRLAMKYWMACQDQTNGFWRYQSSGYPPTGSMTCAGIASMIIASDTLNVGEAVVRGNTVSCCGEREAEQLKEADSIAKGFGWLDRWTRSLDLGPVLTGLALSGRVGASIASELATMRVTEQIDAMAVMAVNPVQYLVTPRVIATVVMMPILTTLFNFVAIAAAYAISVYAINIDPGIFIQKVQDFVGVDDLQNSAIKAAFFGVVIAVVGCYKGFYASGGAKGVGSATTSSVVTSTRSTRPRPLQASPVISHQPSSRRVTGWAGKVMMDDASITRLKIRAVSFGRGSVYSDVSARVMKGASETSMRRIHLMLALPSKPGTRRRAG